MSKRRHGGIAEDGPARWPDLMEATRFRKTRVVLAAAHLDSDPINNRLKICARSVNAVTCCRIGRTIWRSAGSLTAGVRQTAISSSVRTRH